MDELSQKVRCSLLVGSAMVNTYCLNVLFPAEPLIIASYLEYCLGKRGNWQGPQFPACKEEINLLALLSDISAEWTRFT
jgi:hypothetical protein